MRAVYAVAAIILLGSCSPSSKPGTRERAPLVTTLSRANLGKRITMVGKAVDRKGGAVLVVGNTHVWMQGLHSWPAGFYEGGDRGVTVRVTGVLAEDHGLPVFVQKKGDPIVQGMPVPEGTDLKKASHRWLFTKATWVKE